MDNLILLILLLIIVFGGLIVMYNQQKKLDDPKNTEVVYIEQIPSVSQLSGSGRFRLRTYRQSGNLQKDDLIFNNAAEAIKAAVSSFKRSKIPYVVIRANTTNMLSFSRPYHCHRGRQEGKKMGAIEIIRF